MVSKPVVASARNCDASVDMDPTLRPLRPCKRAWDEPSPHSSSVGCPSVVSLFEMHSEGISLRR